MKKILLSLAAVALGCSAMSAADLLYDLQFGNTVNVDKKYYPNISSYSGSFDYTLSSNEVFTIDNFNNNNNGWTDMIKCGSQKGAYTGMITTKFKVPAEISSIELGISKINETGKVKSFSVETSSDNATWTAVATATEADYDATAKTVTLEVGNVQPGLYYRVAIDCDQCKSNGLVFLNYVKYFGNWTVTGDKRPAELSFPKPAYTVPDGTKYFTEAKLSNPNELTVTYTSSDPSVAVYDAANDVVQIKGLGTTVITASSAETEDFVAGEASYTLNVVTPAKTVKEMMTLAPQKGDKVWVGCDLTVVYVNGQYVYVVDDYDNPTLLYGSNSYKLGDMIPRGWQAENALYSGLLEWKGDFPEASTTVPETYIKYPTLTTITTADVNAVGWIENINLPEGLPAKGKNTTATLADGTEITVRNQFGLMSGEDTYAAGTYRMKAAVAIYNGTLQLYPVELLDPADVKVEPTFPESINVICDTDGFTIDQEHRQGDIFITVKGYTLKDSVKIHLDTPEGWDGFIFRTEDAAISNEPIQPLIVRAVEADWLPLSAFTGYGFTQGNTITVQAETFAWTESIDGYLIWDGKADSANAITIEAKIRKGVDPNTGVEAIEAAEENAEYYTLQGVKVENPSDGIYVKVVNGKASKVVL